MAGVFGGGLEQREEVLVGVAVEVDVQVLVTDHVGVEQGLDAWEGAVLRPAGGEMAGAVGGVLRGPGFYGLFAVEEDEPDAVARGRMGAEVLANFDEQGRGAGAVVGPDEGDVLEGVVGLVVVGEDDDPVLLDWIGAGELDDQVVHRLQAGGGGGGEAVDLEAVVLLLRE